MIIVSLSLSENFELWLNYLLKSESNESLREQRWADFEHEQVVLVFPLWQEASKWSSALTEADLSWESNNVLSH